VGSRTLVLLKGRNLKGGTCSPTKSMDSGNLDFMMMPICHHYCHLPYMGFVAQSDPIYKNTRALVLSKKNPFYYANEPFKGEGSSHTQRDYIWPLALMVQILTSDSDDEIKKLSLQFVEISKK
jgi:meiotically up-regulated gene 157 (Mug157) protein